MRNNLCVALLSFCVIGLAGCSDDEKEFSGARIGAQGTTLSQPPTLTNAGIIYPVTQAGNQDYTRISIDWYYEYENNRLCALTDGHGGYEYTFSYNPLSIAFIGEKDYSGGYGDPYSVSDVYNNFKANGMGFVTYYENHYKSTHPKSDYYDEGWDLAYTLKYDSEGHLIQVAYKSLDTKDGDSWVETDTYTWKDGNLIAYCYNEVWTDEDGEKRTDTEDWFFEYGEDCYPNSGIYFQEEYCSYIDDFLFNGGMAGKYSKNIPTSFTRTYIDEKGNYTENYTVKEVLTNEDGSIRKIIVQTGNNNNQYAKVYGYATYPLVSTKAIWNTAEENGQKSIQRKRSLRNRHRKQ